MNLRKDHYRILSFIQRDFEKFSGSKLWVGGLSAADLTSFSARPRPIFGLPHHAQRSAFRWVRLCLLKVLRPSKSFVFFALPPREELLKKYCHLKNSGQFWSTVLIKKIILYSGSLGSGVDEERSKLRVGM